MSRVSQLSPAPQVPVLANSSLDRDCVHRLIDKAGSTGPFNARQILSEHPHLRGSKSAVIDLAYEEYCRRVDAGEKVDVEHFAHHFPGYQTSLIRTIEAHHD